MTSSEPKKSQPHGVAIETMTRLAAAGVRVAPDGANLRYWAAMPLSPELREEIVRSKAELLAYLAVWNGKRALALTTEADSLVESLGVPGSDPEILAAVDRCIAAQGKQDMAGLRAACFAIEDRARTLAALRSGG
jgi:hypothetical protein